MGKIILIKNNKGGVGKSWLTLQIACGLVKKNKNCKKVLILSSDSQNNVLQFAGYKEKLKNGLEKWLELDNGDYAVLRDKIYYIPVFSDNVTSGFKYNLKNFMEIIKKEFDYILIDSTPVLKLDSQFLEVADEIVIPTFLDAVTTQSVVNMINQSDISKIKAIIPNRCMNTKVEYLYLSELKRALINTNIFISEPIKQSAFLLRLMDNGKTIYDSQNKVLEPFKKLFEKIIGVIE